MMINIPIATESINTLALVLGTSTSIEVVSGEAVNILMVTVAMGTLIVIAGVWMIVYRSKKGKNT